MRFALVAGALLAGSAWGQPAPTAQDLKRCLDDLGGIAWRLPYSPRMWVDSCSSPAGSYRPKAGVAPQARELYLTAGVAPEPDAAALAADERGAAMQSAAAAHFEALFRRHGYLRAGTSNRFSRPDGAALIWEMRSDNTWRITLEERR